MQTLAEIKQLLEDAGLSPRKALGQNFLIDQNLLTRLVHESGVGPGDVVLEVGPGTGTLTEALLDAGCEVIACELDRGLATLLRERLVPRGLTLIEGDCLEKKRRVSSAVLDALGARPFSLVSNLPYGAATPLMASLMLHHPNCRSMSVTVQKEVAERMVAVPATRAFGPLAVIASLWGEARRIALLPPECFWPRPQVQSAMIGLRAAPSGPAWRDVGALESVLDALFTARRKQLGKVLGRDLAWPEGVDPTARAETLTPEQIEQLSLVVRSG